MSTMDLRRQTFLNNLNIFDRCYGKSQKILLPEQQGSGSASIGCSPGVTAGLKFSLFSAFSLRRQAQGAVRRFARSATIQRDVTHYPCAKKFLPPVLGPGVVSHRHCLGFLWSSCSTGSGGFVTTYRSSYAAFH